MLKAFTNFQLGLIDSVLPAAFLYFWTLIAGDLINFSGSRRKLYSYSAKDMVNCYQNYAANSNGEVEKVE